MSSRRHRALAAALIAVGLLVAVGLRLGSSGGGEARREGPRSGEGAEARRRFIAALAAGSAGGAAADAVEHRSAIRGRVLAAGAPVPGATVMLFAMPAAEPPGEVFFDFDTGPDLCDPAAPPPRDRAQELAAGLAAHEEEPSLVAAATSDGEGRFELPAAGGSYSVWVESPSGVAARGPVHPGEDVDLRVARAWFARGRVRDERGQPLSGARVAAVPVLPGPTVQSTTSADGAFSVGPLAADRYELIAARDGLLPVASSAVRGRHEEIFLRLGAPHRISGQVVRGERGVGGADVCVADFEGAIHTRTGPDGRFTFDGVRPGIARVRGGIGDEQVELELRVPPDREDVTLSLDKAVRVVGTVRDESGNAVAGAAVTIFATSGTRTLRTAEEGSFRADGLAPGGARVSAVARGFLATESDAQQTMAGGEARFEIVLKRPFVISGAVMDPEGAPVAGASVGAGPIAGVGVRITYTNERGAFSIDWDSPGSYELVVAHDLFRDATVQTTAPGLLAITLERGFSLEGTVLDEDGQPLPNRMVDVSPADAGARKRTVETDEHGTFRVGGLSEGRYTLTVLTAAFLGDTDVLASATADVPAMQRLVLRALSFGRISGTVVDEEGRPVWGAEVDGSAEDRPELDPNAPYAGASWRTASSDQQGHFELRRLREGTFRVTAAATADDDLRSSLVAGPVSVRAGEAQIVLKLRPGERIEIEPLDLGTSAE